VALLRPFGVLLQHLLEEVSYLLLTRVTAEDAV
jgi:hypothetical protein